MELRSHPKDCCNPTALSLGVVKVSVILNTVAIN